MSIRLNEYDKSEWWDVYRQFRPNDTAEQYAAAWDEFQKLKTKRKAS